MCDYCGETGQTHESFIHAEDCSYILGKAVVAEIEEQISKEESWTLNS
jgi:hypothetical protein